MTATNCITHRTREHTTTAGPHGPALQLGEHTYLPLERTVTRIGRGFEADVQLEDHSVSQRHAILVDSAAGVILLDDTSTNGTFVNGHRTARTLLQPGDEITVGRVALRYIV